MVENVFAHNPDTRVLERAKKLLKKGQLVAFPTDTNWVITCDPFIKKGVENFYRLKNAERSKHFSLLCSSLSMATDLAYIGDQIFRQIHKKIPGHYTFIFKARKKITRVMKASKADHEVGIRFPPGGFTSKFLEHYEGPLLSANITHEMLGVDDHQIEIYSYLIDDELGHQLGMIIEPDPYNIVGTSTIIDFTQNSEAQIMREGIGEWP